MKSAEDYYIAKIEELATRNAEFEAENERLQEQLQDAIEAMRWGVLDHKDAERYRWLKAQHDNWESSWRVYQPHPTLGSVAIDQGLPEHLDDVIDAAMKGSD